MSREPAHAQAWHYLGVIAHQMGRSEVAVELMERSIGILPENAEFFNNLGNALRANGKIDGAIKAFHRAVALKSNYPEAHFNLGVVLAASGDLEKAIGAYRGAISVRSDYAEAYSNLGLALKEIGRLDEAVASCRKAIDLRPGLAEAHNNLGNALKDLGKIEEAIAAYQQAISIRPTYPEALYNLGVALVEKGEFGAGIASYRQAIGLRPDYAEAWSNLGGALKDEGEIDEAIAAYRHAILIRLESAEAHYNLGNALICKGQLDEAISACREAIRFKPDYPEAFNNLGIALKQSGLLDEAVAACQKAIALRPDYAEAYSNLGTALRDQGLLTEAIAAFRKAIVLRPNLPEIQSNLGNALRDTGDLDGAIAAYREAIALRPDLTEAHDNLILSLHYHPDYSAETIAEEHRIWNQQHAEPLRGLIPAHSNDRDPERRLRIGYVSADFRQHSVSSFLLPVLENHDAEGFEVFIYSDVAMPDAITARLRTSADQWCNVCGLSDRALAELIRGDGIDILVDLAGHTADNRLPVFALRAAPVQVNYLGYPNTTGMGAMDYRIVDCHTDIAGVSEGLCSEKLMRLPDSFLCYSPPNDSPEVVGLPVKEIGLITFGCFNAAPKLNRPLLTLWSEILHGVPCSRMLLKNASLADEAVRADLLKTFGELGISDDRIELIARAPSRVDHLRLYRRMDIALDTFPYHGTTTTCEALWMGVPVIALAGQTHVSRVGVSLLTHAGYSQWIAGDSREYVEKAIALASDKSELAQIRRSLRSQMLRSALMNAPVFVRNLEGCYRQMWRKWGGRA